MTVAVETEEESIVIALTNLGSLTDHEQVQN